MGKGEECLNSVDLNGKCRTMLYTILSGWLSSSLYYARDPSLSALSSNLSLSLSLSLSPSPSPSMYVHFLFKWMHFVDCISYSVINVYLFPFFLIFLFNYLSLCKSFSLSLSLSLPLSLSLFLSFTLSVFTCLLPLHITPAWSLNSVSIFYFLTLLEWCSNFSSYCSVLQWGWHYIAHASIWCWDCGYIFAMFWSKLRTIMVFAMIITIYLEWVVV